VWLSGRLVVLRTRFARHGPQIRIFPPTAQSAKAFLTRFDLIVAVAVYLLKALFLQLADTKRRLIARLGSGKIRLCPIELV
jgi:hypothetical protein